MDNNHTQNFNHLEYTVIRSNRKSICIEIGPDLQIKVRAPQKMPDSQIRAFVVSKNKWRTFSTSPLFWAEVEKVLPNYKELRKELRQYSC